MRRPFRIRPLSWLQIVLLPVVAIVGALAWVALLGAGPHLLVWIALCGVGIVLVGGSRARRPADPGVQVYEQVDSIPPGALPSGVPSSQLFVPCGLALGWFVRRGLVSDWFRAESAAELAEFDAGRTSGPQLYAWWHGILASDMLDDEGRAFARRYLWGVEPWGTLREGARLGGRVPRFWPDERQRWFARDLAELQGGRATFYLLGDDAETAAAFDRLADRRLAHWRRWRFAYALWESERGSVHRDDARFEPADVARTWLLQ